MTDKPVQRTFSGAPWETKVGYCRAIRMGNIIAVTGTTSLDENGELQAPGDAYAQAKRCLEIIERAIRPLGAGRAQIIRTRMFVTDIKRWEEFGRAHGEFFASHPPATTMVEVKALIDPRMLIEIEADAVISCASSAIALYPWAEGDLAVLERGNTPEMTAHIGGPETPEQILSRHHRYLKTAEPGKVRMFTIRLYPSGTPVGSIGYWEITWQGEQVYETGWEVFPEYQGRGIATQALTELISILRVEGKYRSLHAFPRLDNNPSNAICKKLGFSSIGECEFEYPRGTFLKSNDWRLALPSDQAKGS